MEKSPLNRESLLRGDIRKLVEGQDENTRFMTDSEREEWIDKVIAVVPSHCSHDSLWVFGYGSLIWNPAFHFTQQRVARVHGYHRRFCLWTHLGRGRPGHPGLMLGLDRGGSCTGVGFQIDKNSIRSELDILFRRELISHAYVPTWVKMRFTDGSSHSGITFVMDRQHERYVTPDIDIDTQVHHIATAEGPLGANKDYLYDLVDHLEKIGLHDHAMSRLESRVRNYNQ